MGTRRLSDQSLVVDRDLIGRELPSPRRRLAAFAIDAGLLFVPSTIIAFAVALLGLALVDPLAFDALAGFATGADEVQGEDLMVALTRVAVEREMPGVPRELERAWEDGDLEEVRRLTAGTNFVIGLQAGSDDTRAEDGVVVIDLGRFVPASVRALSSYGLAAAYFALLTAGRRRATPGKRWLGLEVRVLDGSRLGRLVSLERFLGYWQVPASFGIALADLWRDPNRRLPHDRLVNTVVVRRGGSVVPSPTGNGGEGSGA